MDPWSGWWVEICWFQPSGWWRNPKHQLIDGKHPTIYPTIYIYIYMVSTFNHPRCCRISSTGPPTVSLVSPRCPTFRDESTGWGPPVISGFINHYNYYSYIYHKATEIRQLSYLGGPILYWFLLFDRCMSLQSMLPSMSAYQFASSQVRSPNVA